MSIFLLLALAAFVCVIAAAVGRAPLWVAVILLVIIELLRDLPLGK
jgi:hypothetical protein